jgi:hypothetical protein
MIFKMQRPGTLAAAGASGEVATRFDCSYLTATHPHHATIAARRLAITFGFAPATAVAVAELLGWDAR